MYLKFFQRNFFKTNLMNWNILVIKEKINQKEILWVVVSENDKKIIFLIKKVLFKRFKKY